MESQKVNKASEFAPYAIMGSYIIGIIVFSLVADSKYLVVNLFISLMTVMYIYHLRSGNKSLRGIKIDNTFLIPAFLLFVYIAYLSLSRSDSGDVYKVSKESQILECEKTGEYTDESGEKKDCELMDETEIFWKSKKAITIYIISSGCFFVLYEIFKGKVGIKEAGVRILTIGSTCALLIIIAVILFGIGKNTDDQSKSSELELKDIRSNYIFKGGIGSFGDLASIEKNKIIYNGDPTKVQISRENVEAEDIHCSVSNDKENKLWRCDEEQYNRIESKCGGDWWITSDKGCLTDSFSELYRIIYLMIIFILIIVSLISMVKVNDIYSVDTFKPIIIIYIVLFIYHLIYFVTNYIVSWTHDEAILFQDYLSEFLKGINGYWFNDIVCDDNFKETKSLQTSKMEDSNKIHKDIEIKYKTVWDQRGVTPKLKILLNMIILIAIIIYFIRFILKNYGVNIVSNVDVLGKNSKDIFKYLIIFIISLTISQFVYGIYSTLIADDCIVERITGKNRIDDIRTQEYCIGKTPDKDDECKSQTRKYECYENENCIVNNSYNANELLRCQFDSHGGMYYHIICLVVLPIIFVLFKSSSVLDYIK